MYRINKGDRQYIICAQAQRKIGCIDTYWIYQHFEQAFLAYVKELDLKTLELSDEQHKARKKLEQEIESALQLAKEEFKDAQSKLEAIRDAKDKALETVNGAESTIAQVLNNDPNRWRAGGLVGDPFSDIARDGGLLVGVRCSEGPNWDGALQAIQPIYQVGTGYVLGTRHGNERVGDEHEAIAKPGYAVGAMNVRNSISLFAIQLVFYRINGNRLDPSDQYSSDWMGAEGGGLISLDAQGKPIVGLSGTWADDLKSIEIHPVEQLMDSVPLATERPPDLWSEPRVGKILGLGRGTAFSDVSKANGVLVGLRVFQDPNRAEVICGLQAIYLSSNGYEEGNVCGKVTLVQTMTVARPGYRVGGVACEALGGAAGLQLRYVAMEGNAPQYQSPWLGFEFETAHDNYDVGSRFAVGISGYFQDSQLTGMGFIMVGRDAVSVPSTPNLSPDYHRAAFASKPLRFGDPHGKPFSDHAPNGGVLVGLRLAKGMNWGGALQAIQPIYQSKDSYVLGQRHGKSGGEEIEVLAKPGYAIGAINVRAGLVVNAVQVIFYRIDGMQLNPNDRLETQWIGCDGGSPSRLDPRGDPITQIFGTWEEDLISLGLQPSSALPESLPLAAGQTIQANDAVAEEPLRTWTSADGKFTVEARLVSVEDDTVVLKRADGRMVKIALTKLSDADREFVREQAP
jgi:hypothetical protein